MEWIELGNAINGATRAGAGEGNVYAVRPATRDLWRDFGRCIPPPSFPPSSAALSNLILPQTWRLPHNSLSAPPKSMPG